MPNSNQTALSSPSFRGHIDVPGATDSIYDEAIFVSGWVHASGRDSPYSSVRAYLSDILIGETTTPFYRADVCSALGLSRHDLTGFRILGRIPDSTTGHPVRSLRVVASWGGQLSHTLVERTLKVASGRLDERPHGRVVAPTNGTILHRDDIYGSGPPLENPSGEICELLQNYLPEGSSVLDVGCGAGAYGPPLISAGHVWLGLEQSAHCCQILERRRLPFRRVESGSLTLPCESEEWDCCISVEVLEHVKEPERFIGELARVSRRRVLMSVPNMEILPYMHEWGAVPWHLLEADHKNFFTRSSLSRLLEKAFRAVEVFPYGVHPLISRDNVTLYQHLFAIADK